jgi:arylsulfatase A-like enzyme
MRDAVKAGKPFFVQVSHYGFGSEEEATPEAFAIARERAPGLSGKPLAAVAGAYDVDRSLGRLRDALAELGVAGNTFILYSSDHGAQGGGGGRNGALPNPPFHGAKGSVAEGGIRVPFIVAGPGIEHGAVSHVRATGMDLLPTLRDLAGAPLPKPADPDARTAVEGGSLAAVLRAGGKGTVIRPREAIVIHFPHYDLNNGGPASAIYLGDYKLVRNDDSQTTTLFDIVHDPTESKDLASAMPDRVQDLTRRLDAYLDAIKAPRATAPNS